MRITFDLSSVTVSETLKTFPLPSVTFPKMYITLGLTSVMNSETLTAFDFSLVTFPEMLATIDLPQTKSTATSKQTRATNKQPESNSYDDEDEDREQT